MTRENPGKEKKKHEVSNKQGGGGRGNCLGKKGGYGHGYQKREGGGGARTPKEKSSGKGKGQGCQVKQQLRESKKSRRREWGD